MSVPRRRVPDDGHRPPGTPVLDRAPWRRLRKGFPPVVVGSALALGLAALVLGMQPRTYRATALVRSLEWDLGPSAGRTRGAGSVAVDATEAGLLTGRAALESLVLREGLRLVDPSLGELPAWVRDVSVGLPDDGTLELSLRLGPTSALVSSGDERVRAEYGRPLTLGGIRLTVPGRPAADEVRLRVEPLQTALERAAAGLELRTIGGGDVVEIAYRARQPGVAVRVASAAALVLEQESARNARARAHSRRLALEERLRTQDSAVAVARAALDSLRSDEASVAGGAGRAHSPDDGGQVERLGERDVARRLADLEALGERLDLAYDEARFQEAVEGGRIEVVRLAVAASAVPKRTVPKLLLAAMGGALVGAVLSVAGGGIRRPIGGREGLEAALRIRTLAVIPRIEPIPVRSGFRRLVARGGGGRRSNGHGPSRPGRNGGSAERTRGNGAARRTSRDGLLDEVGEGAGVEAFRTLRTNLLFSRSTRAGRSILVTSPGPREGKTTTVANLGVVVARQGLRVLVLDADLRNADLARRYGLPGEPGLTEVLLGEVELPKAVRRTDRRHLALLPAGRRPDNPSELLGGSRMESVIRHLTERYDFVIVDSPPVLLASEATVLAALVEGVLLVVHADETDCEAARHALAQLNGVDAEVLGGVLNMPRSRTSTHRSYYRHASQSEVAAT